MNAEVVLLVLDSQTAAFQDTTAFHVSVRAVARWVPPQLRSRGFTSARLPACLPASRTRGVCERRVMLADIQRFAVSLFLENKLFAVSLTLCSSAVFQSLLLLLEY
jgi:hypothetical protein